MARGNTVLASNADRRAAGLSGRNGDTSSSSAPAPAPVAVAPPPATPAGPAAIIPAGPAVPVPAPTGDPTFANIAKTLIPYLSPEDARTQAALYGAPAPTTPIPGQIDAGVRNQFLSADRANQALAALENGRVAAGSPNYGPGYEFLKNALGLLSQFGSPQTLQQQNVPGKSDYGDGMSRENYDKLQTGITNLVNSVKGDKTYDQYSALAQTFLNPTFSAGALMPTSKVSGETFYGAANKKLFT